MKQAIILNLNDLLEQCKVREGVQRATSMIAHIEADRVPFPEWTAEIAPVLPCSLLLDFLRAVTLEIFQIIITEAALIFISAVTGITRFFLIFPFVSATAATIT